MKEIHIDIDPDGNVTVEAHGYTGTSCRTATAALEKALGQVTGRNTKPEAVARDNIRQQRLKRS
jgi:hypothetical protein